MTDGTGVYRLSSCPPATTRVTFTLEGFRSERGRLAVAARPRHHARHHHAAAGLRGDHVVGRAPVVDTTTTTLGTTSPPPHRDAAHRAQLLLGRAGHPRRLLRRQPRQPGPVDDHRLRLVRRGERLLHRRRQHDERRVRLPGQGAQLRVHPGGGRQDRRLRGRVRPLDRRHHQRHHQVGRQRVPRRRLRLLRQRLPAGQRQDGRLDRRHRERLHPRGLRRRPRRLHRQRQALVLRRLRPGRQHARQRPARPVRLPAQMVTSKSQPRPRRRPS